MSDFNMQSTDPLHWATEMAKIGRTLDDPMDEGWILGWFANYGVAVYDQQQEEIEQLKARLKVLQDAAIQVNNDVWVLKLNAETKRALQGEQDK